MMAIVKLQRAQATGPARNASIVGFSEGLQEEIHERENGDYSAYRRSVRLPAQENSLVPRSLYL